MKKKLLFLMIMMLLPIITFAKDFTLEDTEIYNIKIPDNWYVVTRDNFDDVYEEYGIPESFYDTLINNNYYLDALPLDRSYEIFIIKKDYTQSYPNFKDLNDSEIIKAGENTQFADSNLAVYTTNYNKYLTATYVDTSTSKIIYINDYLSIYNNSLYQIKVQKQNFNFTDEEKETIKNIIDSIKYGKDNKNDIILEKATNNIGNIGKYIIIGLIAFVIIAVIIIIIVIVLLNQKKKKNVQINNNIHAINYQTDYNEMNNQYVTHLQRNNVYDSNQINEEKKEEVKNNNESTNNVEEKPKEDINPLIDIKIENTDDDQNKNS